MAYRELPLSESTDGQGILVTGVDTGASVLIHTATASVDRPDKVTAYVHNNHTDSVYVFFEIGEDTATKIIPVLVPSKKGMLLAIPGLPLLNSKTLKAFAATANVITVTGGVGRDV